MAINPRERYPGNTTAPDADYPYGGARNDSFEDAGDGTPLEQGWVNDWFALTQAALDFAGITPNEEPDTAQASQILEALRLATGGDNLSFAREQSAGTSVLGRIDGEAQVEDLDWTGELEFRVLFSGTQRIVAEHQTPDTTGDGLHEMRVTVNGSVVGTVYEAPADGTWYERTFDVTVADGDRVALETRMTTGTPPRQGLTRNRSVRGDNPRLHIIPAVGTRTESEAVRIT